MIFRLTDHFLLLIITIPYEPFSRWISNNICQNMKFVSFSGLWIKLIVRTTISFWVSLGHSSLSTNNQKVSLGGYKIKKSASRSELGHTMTWRRTVSRMYKANNAREK